MNFSRGTTKKFLFILLVMLLAGFFIRVGADILKNITEGTPFNLSLFFLRIVEFALPSVAIILIRKLYIKKT